MDYQKFTILLISSTLSAGDCGGYVNSRVISKLLSCWKHESHSKFLNSLERIQIFVKIGTLHMDDPVDPYYDAACENVLSYDQNSKVEITKNVNSFCNSLQGYRAYEIRLS